MKISKNTEMSILGLGLGLLFVVLPVALLWQDQPSSQSLRVFLTTTIAVAGVGGLIMLGTGVGLRLRRAS